jgi:hypothetical protein
MESSDSSKQSPRDSRVKRFPIADKRRPGPSRSARRGFIASLALLATAGPLLGTPLPGASEQATVSEAILYVRRLNAAEVRYNTINGRFSENLAELELANPPVGWSLDVHAQNKGWTVLLTQGGHDAVAIYSNSSGVIRKGVLSPVDRP